MLHICFCGTLLRPVPTGCSQKSIRDGSGNCDKMFKGKFKNNFKTDFSVKASDTIDAQQEINHDGKTCRKIENEKKTTRLL